MSDDHELPHRPGRGSLWAESWYFDFAAPDGSLGGYVRLGHYPNRGLTWLWVVLGGSGSPVPAVVGLAELADRGDTGLDASNEDLGLALLCVESDRTWSVGARFSTGDGRRGELDLVWTGAETPYRYSAATRYEQPCRVDGVVTVAGSSLEVMSWPGQRDHSWGIRDWWRLAWVWCAGALEDGTRFQGTRLVTPRAVPPDGYVLAPGTGVYEPVERMYVEPGPSAGPLKLEIDDICIRAHPILPTAVPLSGSAGAYSRLDRTMCRFETTDGTRGVGWLEHNQPITKQRPG